MVGANIYVSERRKRGEERGGRRGRDGGGVFAWRYWIYIHFHSSIYIYIETKTDNMIGMTRDGRPRARVSLTEEADANGHAPGGLLETRYVPVLIAFPQK